MKKIQRMVSLLLVCCLFVPLLPVSAQAAIVDSGTCGDNLTWTLDTAGLLTISGEGVMEDYDGFQNPAPWEVAEITSVILEDGVQSIGEGAFGGCCELANVEIPESVTTIGRYAFFTCNNLTNVVIPSSVTQIGSAPFHSNTYIRVASGNQNYTSIKGSLFDKKVTQLIKYYPEQKGTYTVPDSVTTIGASAFYECTNLTGVELPSGLETIESGAFEYCDNLSDLELPDGVTFIGDLAFAGCVSLRSLVIPKGVSQLGEGAFWRCSQLTNIKIPNSVTTIATSAFEDCEKLTSVIIPSGITDIGYCAFSGCDSLTDITIPSSVVSIGEGAFQCNNLTDIEIPSSVMKIGRDAFSGNTCIRVEGGNQNYSSIEGSLFDKEATRLIEYYSSGKGTYTVPDSVKVIGQLAFAGSDLLGVEFPDGLVTIENSAFFWCENLTDLELPDGVTAIEEQAFEGCIGLNRITIPERVTSIGEAAFYNCNSLTDVYYAGSVEEWNNIDIGFGNQELTDATIHYSFTTIEDYAYYGDDSLTNMTIPEGVTTIGEQAFAYCENLTSITIPSSVTSIGKEAFAHCTELKEVNYSGTRADWSNIQIGTGNDCLTINYCLDVWDFANSASEDAFGNALGGYYISAKDYAKLTSNLSNTEIELVTKSGNKLKYNVGGTGSIVGGLLWRPYIDWNGSCYGMSLWTCLVNQGILQPTDIDTNIQKLNKHLPTLEAESAINFYHFQQNLIYSSRNGFLKMNQKKQLQILEQLGKNANQTGRAFLIEYMWCRSYNEDGTCIEEEFDAHTVVGYGWEQLSEPFRYEGRIYNYRILIYDCAYPDHLDAYGTSCDMNLYYNDDGYMCIPGWEFVSMPIKAAANKHNNGFIWFVTDNISAMNYVDYRSNDTNVPDYAEAFLTIYAPAKYTLEWSNHTAQIAGFTVDSDAEDHGISVSLSANVTTDGNTVPSTATVSLPDAEEYTVSSEEGVLDFCFHNENYLTSITAEASGSITFWQDGNMTMTTEEPTAYYINMVANEGQYDLPWYKVEVSGENTAEVSAEKTNEGIVIHSDNLDNIVVAVTDDNGTVEISTTTENDAVLITEKAGELVVAVDKDDDGIFETDITDSSHKEHMYSDTVTAPTCTEGGYTTHTCACGDSYTDSETEALGHDWLDGTCKACGTKDPDCEPEEEGKITRLAGNDRFLTAIAVADQMKAEMNVEKFDAVIVASGTNFADALSGSYLAAVKNAPILLSCNEDFNPNPSLVEKCNAIVLDYIKENLNADGVVYILGGPKAVTPVLDEKLDGYRVKRLAGANRYATNIAILEEAGVVGKDVLICNGEGFADSLSASATELPILLVNSKYGLFDLQKPFLEGCDGKLYIIGGTSAVNSWVESQLQKYGSLERIGGKDRFETSVMIAEQFFETPDAAVVAYGWNFPDGLCGGPLASTMGAPLILTMNNYEAKAAAYIQGQNLKEGIVLGGESLISDKGVRMIFDLVNDQAIESISTK